MFTGLVESIGKVQAAANTPVGKRLKIPLGQLIEDARLGDSICVNGVCLTIAELAGDCGVFDVMAETVRVSTLQDLRAGDKVNLERALKAGDRLGGHIVQGHVDGVGVVSKVEKMPDKYVLWISAGAELMKLMISKGSVAINGVSLTLVEVRADRFNVWLIPTTLGDTNLSELRVGDKVNLEADLMGKWINKRLDAVLEARGGLNIEKLRQNGF